MDFKVEDFMVSTGTLASFNYVLVEDSPENVEKLKNAGCTDEEIDQMRDSDDDCLDIYATLLYKGYRFIPPASFIREIEYH